MLRKKQETVLFGNRLLFNKEMNSELEQIPADCKYQEKVDSAEESRVLSTYVAELAIQ